MAKAKTACGWAVWVDGPFLRAKHRKKDGGDCVINLGITTEMGQSLPDALRELAWGIETADVMRLRREGRPR
jgi:hypothetical protein